MTVLTTSLSDVELAPLEARHAESLLKLLKDNLSHLTAHGDYAEQVASTLDELVGELREPTEGRRFGIFLQHKLIGRIDLVPVAPPRYGTGYWLARNATGKGYATAALKAVVDFASKELGATDIFAGVTQGNRSSVAVLERTGFRPVERFDR